MLCLAAALAATLLFAMAPAQALAEEQTDSATTEVYLAPGKAAATQSASLTKTGDATPIIAMTAAGIAAVAAATAVAIAKRRAASNGIGGGDPR